MSSTNGEEPPLKKKKPSIEPNSISSLPDDLIVSCLARASRLHYPVLSLVSKSFGSLLTSPEIYQTRSLLNRTEKCLYVCIQFPSDLKPPWFNLCKKPKEEEMSSGYALAPVKILNSPILEGSNLIAVDSNLYAIKETDETPPCSTNISFIDCRTHTWREAPGMRIADTGNEYDGKLYLPGTCENPESASLNWMEVFNTKTQTWNHPLPWDKRRLFEIRKLEGKIYRKQSGEKGVVYMPKESTWEVLILDKISDRFSYCMIENVLYTYKNGFNYLYTCSHVPRRLKGLQGLPKFASYSSVKLVDYGGKLMVLWDKYVPARGEYKEKMIWCAEISLEIRENGEEIWGDVEWVDAVLKVPKSYKFLYAIAATV